MEMLKRRPWSLAERRFPLAGGTSGFLDAHIGEQGCGSWVWA